MAKEVDKSAIERKIYLKKILTKKVSQTNYSIPVISVI